jgi:hypothetical protein
MTAITVAREEQVPSRINRDEPVIFQLLTSSFLSYHHHLLVLVLVYLSLLSLQTPLSARLVSSRTHHLLSNS